ncbi:gene transfer agent family protein [Hoeflea sp. YIM 152468]|uniref:gene transfer agent family protein n=1 Tax=Hoeflea sp. YIM 152468 TaxID=3031759 RepID=UPI0023DBE6D3|nr:gene transfer agent family protein [Hoeflea sp. YIM 152468]MDF1607277.1 gene transfer agent family protein [Hoeflea sp. YIM 152468]
MPVHPNRHRGEIAAIFDGETRLLCLTLGALAELESGFGVDNLADLAGRFAAGRLSASDIIRIVGAGLRGAGNRLSDEDVAQMSTEGGVSGFARIATELLWASFDGEPAGATALTASDREEPVADDRQNPPGPQAAIR